MAQVSLLPGPFPFAQIIFEASHRPYGTIELMTVRFATQDETSTWNTHILANPDGGNLFQGFEFGEQKKLAGWKIRHVIAGALALTVLEKPIFGLGKVWYIPKGPGVASLSELKNLIPALHAFAKKQGVFTIKIESELPADTSTDAAIVALGVIKTRPIQPNYSTVLIDVRPSLDDIIKALPQKGRHAIRRAERDGVTVKKVPASKQNCEVMFKLLSDTAKGAGFGIRSYDYYEKFWQRYEKAGLGQLFFAYFEGKIVAGAFAIVFGDKGTYKDGASIRERTAYGASHLLQWHIIEWVKQQGAAVHDLCGAPPASEIKNPAHSYYGIGLFKTSFNKTVTEYVGAYQIPVRPLRSKLWTRFLEKLIRKIYYKIHHESYY